MISRLKTRSDPTSRARIATRTSTSRPCVRTSRTSTLANLESPYVIIKSLFLSFYIYIFGSSSLLIFGSQSRKS